MKRDKGVQFHLLDFSSRALSCSSTVHPVKKIQEETNKVFANIFLLLSDVLGVPTFAGDLCILSLIST